MRSSARPKVSVGSAVMSASARLRRACAASELKVSPPTGSRALRTGLVFDGAPVR